jgi:UDP-glucose 4-epimerase
VTEDGPILSESQQPWVLLTGGTSFSGLWFARALKDSNYRVIALVRRPCSDYSGLRRERARELSRIADDVVVGDFGSPEMSAAASKRSIVLLCHHASVVENYKDPHFSILSALASNTNNIADSLMKMSGEGLRGCVYTGTFFEAGEGGVPGNPSAASPYALSKQLSAQIIRFWTEHLGLAFGRYIVPTPFGPYEEPRFASYLARTWLAGDVPTVRAPAYVRDYVPVDLMAKDYAKFCGRLLKENAAGALQCRPSYFPDTNLAFANWLARELSPRFDLACEVAVAAQQDFTEPLTAVNCDRLDPASFNWDESVFFDELAKFYEDQLSEEAFTERRDNQNLC